MTGLGDLIHDISEELLDPRLYCRKGRNCLLLTRRAEDGRLVYAGETDEKRAEQPSTSGSEKNEVHESASASATPLPSHNAPHATIFPHPFSSWTGMYPQAPPFSSDTLTYAPAIQQSLPQVYFSAVHSQPASPSCSVTTTLASFSGQGWERDDALLFEADLTSKPWAHQHTLHLPSQSSPFASPPMMDAPESSLATSATAWPSPSNSNMLWGDSPSFGSTQFVPSSSQTNYQLHSIGGFDAASTAFGQLVPPANDEHGAIAGMNQAMQQTDVWWNDSESLSYGDFWNQTIRN
ncbi:hypothetical protein M407DRAFT_207409 [Tulasnella calospora MUT 4182]|uniref:Uncharacterized protein n=1 Tax=Tulasnella calospora MUT 4182 TaxID=1051891 RepID=A0A0C3QIG2_9AGAM|nr:hypothetical protein M407DRAFT_207409 [Tulasnella calospora MUT 4182]